LITIHSSRSRYETGMHCPRQGYLQYNWGGRGITRAGKNLFLTTGIWTHKGLELIGKWLKANPGKLQLHEDTLQGIITSCVRGYFSDVFEGENKGFDLLSSGLDEEGNRREFSERELLQQQQYIFDEQTALVEAFLRIVNLRLLPIWMKKYKIASVEVDMSFPLVKGDGFEVIQSATIDWVLQEIETKDIYIISFKSYKTFDSRTAKAASHDTQGLSETWAFEEYLRSKHIDKKVMGVKMLYLIKGVRKETFKGSGIYKQSSPLIRGYRRVGFDSVEYAHSWFYPKPENASGIGALGKSWEEFDVFNGLGLEEVGGVKGWIERLARDEIQPECGDILAQQIIEPEAYARFDRDIESWLRQTKSREQEIAKKLLLQKQYEATNLGLERYMDEQFPQARGACHYPTDCEFIPVCFGTEEEKSNPLENGFVWRTPHHKAELLQIEGVKVK
jgi:hypothetical protein